MPFSLISFCRSHGTRVTEPGRGQGAGAAPRAATGQPPFSFLTGSVYFLSTMSAVVFLKHNITQTQLTQEISKTIKTNRCHMSADMVAGRTRGHPPTTPLPTESHACKLFGSLYVSNRLRDPWSVLEGQDLLVLLLGWAGQKFQCLIHS